MDKSVIQSEVDTIDSIIHRIGKKMPFICYYCGKENRRLICHFYYRNQEWFSVNWCSTRHLIKYGLPVVGIKRKKSLYTRYHGLTFGIKEFLIPDQVDIDVKVFQ